MGQRQPSWTWTDHNLYMKSQNSIWNPQIQKKKKTIATILDLLLSAPGTNINSQDTHFATPLMNSVIHSTIALVDLLLERGANVHVTNKVGATVLHVAVQGQKLPIVERLLQYGADPTKKARTRSGEEETATETAEKAHGPHRHKILELCIKAAKEGKFGTMGMVNLPEVSSPKKKKKTKKGKKKRQNSSLVLKKDGLVPSGSVIEKYSWEVEPEDIEEGMKMIGAGGFGIVYKGRFRRTDVAVKMLEGWKHCGPKEKDDLLKDFRKEVDILARLRHQNIVQFYAACVDPDKDVFILTEWADNGDLFNFLQKNKTSTWRQRLSFAMDSARGLVYLHENKPVLLHRDMKSLNILIDRNYVAKLCDFGLSKDTSELATSAENRKFGSLKWVAPELFKGEAHTLYTDVYAFGVVLYELASTKEPWEGLNSIIQIYNKVSAGERPSFEGCTVDPEFKQLIDECWQQDPSGRPMMGKILDRLEAIFAKLTEEC
eukprot:TRINITY_DN2163_c0_g1_i6.p1 TRINITY_DN2163_c0_g1~~TRINITY_DN2163_c0_g1_i6.p1  ORF type:complete len:488 (+),score=108.41 TRINITY_DN2163_c0_g1_i6:436-1899(+)